MDCVIVKAILNDPEGRLVMLACVCMRATESLPYCMYFYVSFARTYMHIYIIA